MIGCVHNMYVSGFKCFFFVEYSKKEPRLNKNYVKQLYVIGCVPKRLKKKKAFITKEIWYVSESYFTKTKIKKKSKVK